MEHPENLAADQPETSREAAGGVAGDSWDDLEVGFSSSVRTKLDERGRLKMPSEFRSFIDKKYGKNGEEANKFFITSLDGETAEIYPKVEWHKRTAKIMALAPSNETRTKLLALDNLYGARVAMDPQGRLAIPEALRDEGVLVGDVMVSGEGERLRVTSLKKLREQVKSKPIGAQDRDFMATIGL
jgi:MraZ protein